MRDKRTYRVNERSSKALCLAVTILLAATSFLPFAHVEVGAATNTTIAVLDPNGSANLVKVTVFDAGNGRQIAGGLADQATGLFTFHSPQSQELVVTVHTSTGYVGSTRVSPGIFAVVTANQNASDTRTVGVLGSQVTWSFFDENGMPIAGANVSVVAWGSFERVARGSTDRQGQFTFRIPNDMTTDDFLATLWRDGGSITLQAAAHPRDPSAAKFGFVFSAAPFPYFGEVK